MYRYNAELLRIVDGDTIDVLIDLGFNITIKERVRLYGIDTPEVRTRNLEEKARGKAASARLGELLTEHFIIETKIDKRGKFGRLLGIIYAHVDGKLTNLNEALVQEGHAERY